MYEFEKALIIVPHPDDEINVAGSMILNLKKANGRYFEESALKRRAYKRSLLYSMSLMSV